MKILITILAFFWLSKNLFFWLWLWQLKEYHLGRFLAHFEAQKIKKLISSFWRIKFPKLTKKIIVISGFGIFLEILLLFWLFSLADREFYFSLLALLILSPLIFSLLVLLFQIPTNILRDRILKKAKQKREKFKDLIVIGITGSYGKTSTKEFLGKILSEKYRVLKTEKHINAEVGIAKAILNDLKDQEIFIAEIGAYEREKIKQVCKMLKPQIGILTGINEQHTATFGSQENIIQAKFELIESLPEEGMAIMNWDNQFINSKLKTQNSKSQLKTKNFYFYSIREKADVWAEEIKIEKEKIFFRAISKNGNSAFFEVNLLGGHNIPNILAAALVAHEKFGFLLSEIAEILEKIKPEIGTMILKKSRPGLNIIDSTYSANPDGVLSALHYLRIWEPKKIIVMPCLIELGKASKDVHKKIGRKIAQVCDLAIITTKDRFKEIKEGALGAGMKPEEILFIENPHQVVEKIKQITKPDDVVLLEGRVPPRVVDLMD